MWAVCVPFSQAGCLPTSRLSAFSLNLRLKSTKKILWFEACRQAAFESASRLYFSLHARCMAEYLNET